jgi:hypothetical protein
MSVRWFLAGAAVWLVAATAPAQVSVVPTLTPVTTTPLVRSAVAPPYMALPGGGFSYTDPFSGVTTTARRVYDPFSGTTTQYGTAYNPSTGITSRQATVYNSYTGVAAGTRTATGPFGGAVTRSGVVNRFTGTGYSTTTRFQPGSGGFGVFRR